MCANSFRRIENYRKRQNLLYTARRSRRAVHDSRRSWKRLVIANESGLRERAV